ncbi:ATP-binding cassette domain-containing protein [Candidatus Woesearchaeota archaeon]|nr:ATP-binding cassette domain-containing protein [Candidatus Woesearchaeota archaeon]
MGKIIEVKGLCKSFDGIKAVNDVSFSVTKGEIFAFLGPNGAGKSTTIKMLTTLLKPDSGKIVMNSFNPASEPNLVRKSFGIVFQDPSIDDELTAMENMEYHGIMYSIQKKTRRARTEELLRMVELWDRKDDLVKHFSGGMKRRLEIARGLLHHPKILFLDEPTTGLDPQTRNHIWEHIKKLNKKERITVFFTTHYMEEAEQVANNLAVIDHGKIVAKGTADGLKRKTKSGSLEKAFIKLTGRDIRAEEAKPIDNLRMRARVWRR